MNLLANLLVLYAGILVINAALSAALWRKSRDKLHGALFFVWASVTVSFLLQGALAQGNFWIVLGFSSSFLVNVALARLLGAIAGVVVRWGRFAIVLAAALGVSALLHSMGFAFLPVALPVAIAVALPLLTTGARVARKQWRALTTAGKTLLASCFLFCLHNIDFAFLRDKPEAAPFGFTVVILILFALSVSAPAVVLEVVSQREARVSAEMDAARRIQTRLLPDDVTLPGLELASHMRPAASVGGDYFDIHGTGEDSWFLLGDVTGHGLGAGLVMLMAQSIIRSILETRPTITPRELNFIANRVLCANLLRLQEQRHMTLVSLCRLKGTNEFLISGSHDNIYLFRTGTGKVETIPVSHFPFGIGFLGELLPKDFREDTLSLEPGDVLFVGTDGITEALRNGDDAADTFGEPALIALLAEHGTRPLNELKTKLVTALDAFTGGVYYDDVAFIILRAKAV